MCSLRLAAFSFLFMCLPQSWKHSVSHTGFQAGLFAIYQTICAGPRVEQFCLHLFLVLEIKAPAKETLELQEEVQATPQKSNTSFFSNLPLLILHPQPVCDVRSPLSRVPMELISSQPVLMQKSHLNVLATSQNTNFICRDALKSQIKDQRAHMYLEGKKAY